MLGSWSNFSEDFLYGNTFDFGNFEQCMSIHHESAETGIVKGQYCMVQFYSSMNATIAIGPNTSIYNHEWKNLNTRFGGAACIPLACSPDVLKEIITEIFIGTDLVLASDYDQQFFCKSENQNRKDSLGVWVTVSIIFVVLITLVIIHTYYDVVERKDLKVKPNSKFEIFSLYTNGKSLFSSSPANSVECVDGIKVLSLLAIIAFHSAHQRKYFPLSDSHQFTDWEKSFTSFLAFGCHNYVESFFVISGLLVARSLMKDFKT